MSWARIVGSNVRRLRLERGITQEALAHDAKVELISGRELAAAARIALRQNLALSDDELVFETARLIGWARVGPDVRQSIEDAVEKYLAGELERDHLERVKLKQT